MSVKSTKHNERHCFLLFWWSSSQAHQKQIAEINTPHPNSGKTVYFNFIIASMLPEKFPTFFSMYGKQKEIPWKTLFSSILMIFHSSSPKTAYTASQLWENSLIYFYNCSDASVSAWHTGTYAWVIWSTTQLWCREGIAPSTKDNLYSGLAEAYGIITVLQFFQHYLSHYP